jgi:hypothetical protein
LSPERIATQILGEVKANRYGIIGGDLDRAFDPVPVRSRGQRT